MPSYTGKCTWPIYQTLGFCSACTDVTDLLTFGCFTTSLDWVPSQAQSPELITTAPTGSACGYFINATSETPLLVSGYRTNLTRSEEILMMRIIPLQPTPWRESLFQGSIYYKHIRDPIADFLVIGAADGVASVLRNQTPTAHECVLSWCVQSMHSSYEWADYQEEVVETFLNSTPGQYPWETPKISEERTNATALDIIYKDNVTIECPSGEIFGASNDTALLAILMFDDMTPSIYSASNETTRPILSYQYFKASPSLRTLDINPWIAPNNVTLHMERLATALTNQIRSSRSAEVRYQTYSGDKNHAYKTIIFQMSFKGTALGFETFVKVSWAWLTLPLLVLLLSFIFLVATVMKTAKEIDHVGIYKSSALATLVYGGLPEATLKQLKSDRVMKTPRMKVEAMRARLSLSKGFRMTDMSPLSPQERG